MASGLVSTRWMGLYRKNYIQCDTGVGRNKLCIHPIRWMCFSDTSLSFLLGSIALYLSITRLLPFNSTWCFHTEIHPNRISTRASESKQGSANKTKRTCIPIQAKTAITTKTDLVTRLKTWKGIGLENRSEDHPNRFNGNVTLSRKSRRDQHLRIAKMESHLGDMHSFPFETRSSENSATRARRGQSQGIVSCSWLLACSLYRIRSENMQPASHCNDCMDMSDSRHSTPTYGPTTCVAA